MRPRNTLVLLVVLAALGAYLYWVELPQQKTQQEQKRLLAFDQASVQAVALDYPDHAIALEKTAEGHWRIVRPLAAAADDTAVQNLLRAVADAQVTRTLEDVSDKLASYGLEQPDARVTLTLKDGTVLPTIKIGKSTQVGFSAYAQKGDDPTVYLTGGALQAGMKKQVKDLRDKTLIAFEDAEVRKLELARGAGTLVIEREGEGDRWTITAPARYPADSAEVRALLASVRGIRADDFVSDDGSADLAPYGLVSPRLKVSVWLGKDQAQKTLLVGGTRAEEQKKTLYAKRAERPTVYTIPDYVLKNVDKDLATLRDKTVLAFDKEKAATLVVTRKDGQGFTLVKRAGAWHVDAPAGAGAERAPTITRFVDDLSSLKGSEIVAERSADLATYGLTSPDVTAAVSDASGAALGTVLAARAAGAGKDDEAKIHVTAAGSDVVYGLKPFVFERIDKKAADFLEPPATPVPSGFTTPAAGAGGVPALGEASVDIGDEDLAGDEDDE